MQNCIVRGGYIVKQNVSTHDISIQRIIFQDYQRNF